MTILWSLDRSELRRSGQGYLDLDGSMSFQVVSHKIVAHHRDSRTY